MKNEINFEYKKVENVNLSRFSEMYKLCLNTEVDEKYFQWKYLENPAGHVVAFEALDQGKPAGFYGIIPERYLVNGKEMIVYQSMDTMTHPDYQKRGLFTNLAKMTYDFLDHMDEKTFIVGIPGSNSFYGFVNKLGWKHVHDFNYIFISRYMLPFLKIFNKSDRLTFKETKSVGLELEDLLQELNFKNKGIRPIIDKEVIDWKILSHPIKKFRLIEIYVDQILNGYSIISLDEKGYSKIEMLNIKDDKSIKRIILYLTDFIFKTSNSLFVYTWEPTNSIFALCYKKAGYLKNPFSKGIFSYKIPLIIYSKLNPIKEIDLFSIESYDYQPIMQD
jgi:hypothetical protein